MLTHIVSDIMVVGNDNHEYPCLIDLQIEVLHVNMIAEHLASGKPLKEYKYQWKKSLMDEVWVPSPKLLVKRDPKRKRDPHMVLDEIHEHSKLCMVCRIHTGAVAIEVGSWGIEKYRDIDVMESFRI